MQPAIRLATPADVPRIVRRWQELIALHQGLESELFVVADHAAGTYGRHVRRQIADRDAVVLVADEGGDLVGYLSGGLGHRAPVYAVREVGMVFDLVVRPDRRRSGLGEALYDAAAAWFRERGVSWMQASWSPRNPASSAFWRKMGFGTLLEEGYRRID